MDEFIEDEGKLGHGFTAADILDEGPYRINRCVPGNAYILETLESEEFSRALNGKYLKKYYLSIWVNA